MSTRPGSVARGYVDDPCEQEWAWFALARYVDALPYLGASSSSRSP